MALEKYDKRDVTSARQALELMERFEVNSVLYAYSWHLIANERSLNEAQRDYHALHTMMSVGQTNGFMPLFDIQTWTLPRLPRVLEALEADSLRDLLLRAMNVVGIPEGTNVTEAYSAVRSFFDRGDVDPSLWDGLKAADRELWRAKTDWDSLRRTYLMKHAENMD